MRLQKSFAVSIGLGLAAFSTSVHAEDVRAPTKPVPATYDWSACTAEIAKFCSGEESRGNEAIYACLFRHDSEQSKGCDAVHAAYEAATGRPVGPPK